MHNSRALYDWGKPLLYHTIHFRLDVPRWQSLSLSLFFFFFFLFYFFARILSNGFNFFCLLHTTAPVPLQLHTIILCVMYYCIHFTE